MTTAQPTDVAPAILAFAATMLAPIVGKSAEAVSAQMKAVEPVFVQVVDSYEIDNVHQVFFCLTNNTLHGVYVEQINVSEPNGQHTVETTSKSGGIFNHDEAQRFLPILVPSRQSLYFKVSFPHCENRTQKTDWTGALRLRISRLEADEPKDFLSNFASGGKTLITDNRCGSLLDSRAHQMESAYCSRFWQLWRNEKPEIH